MQVQRVANAAPVMPSLKALADLAHTWRQMMASHLAYRPEKHYMRGPGPKCRAKHAGNTPAARQ